MRHRWIPLLLAPALALAVSWPGRAQGDDLTELARRARDSVALLEVLDGAGVAVGNGTGFFVDGGLMVTNRHVVEGAASLRAVLADGRSFDVEGILASSVEDDLAVLRVTAEAAEAGRPPALELAPGGVEAGERVVVLGSPLGLSGTLSDGIVAAVRPEGLPRPGRRRPPRPLYQITAPISPGSSGSPVMDLRGRVVGVAVSQYWGGQNLNFAVPSSAVRTLLDASRGQGLERRFGSRVTVRGTELARNLAISALILGAVFFALRRL